ncbi:MAG: hypothetical protein KZQ94_19740 [Candidatus Thiodiazotropha sp. (ex Troendleina suluensis)]|nr:hypothetical protein [Candidatus Thiodiazotropha sp. (ex Troendleina suluensis)]
MVNKSKLRHGLEWISGNTKITIQLKNNDTHMDVVILPDYPKEKDRVVLYLRFHGDHTVEVQDLHGNGISSGYQKCGYGKQIGNIGIQAVYAFYEFSFGDSVARDIMLIGETIPGR